MSADAAGEGRGDAGMIEVELGVADRCQGVINGRLGGVLLGGLLVGGLDAAGTCSGERAGAEEFAVGEIEAGMGAFDLGDGLAQLDLVRVGSIRNSRSPLWTMWPSLKPIWVNVPPTWARSSTCWTAENWPVISIRPSTWR